MSAPAVGAYIRVLAQLQGMQLTDVTSAGGVGLKYITQLERSEVRQPTAATLRRMVDYVSGSWQDVGDLLIDDDADIPAGRLRALEWAVRRGLLTARNAQVLASASPEELRATAEYLRRLAGE